MYFHCDDDDDDLWNANMLKTKNGCCSAELYFQLHIPADTAVYTPML